MSNSSETGIALNIPTQDLGEFLVGLLDRNQSIELNLFRSFSITHDHVDNVFQLVQERISEQNENRLISFSVRYVYSNGSSVELISYEKFKSFNEIKPVVCTKCILSLTYLVKFHNKNSPEKQLIEISFSTNANNEDMPFFILDRFGRIKPKHLYEGKGIIKLKIEHSSVSWGSDIENVLKNKIETISEKRNSYIEFMFEKERMIDIIMYGLHFFLFFSISIIIVKSIDFSVFLNAISLSQSIENRIMVSFVLILTFQHYFFAIIGELYNSMYNYFSDFYEKDSFICINDESIKHMKAEIKKKNKTLYTALGFLTLNVLIAVLANIICAYIAFS